MNHIYSLRFLRHLLSFITLALVGLHASAFSADSYATSSALAKGEWIKISVKETGMHFIPAATLRSWGFTDPMAVRIHGYGGERINDVLSSAYYIDDLPMVQSVNTSEGVYFYAVGTVKWNTLSSGRFYHSINPFSECGYYFVTQSAELLREIPDMSSPNTPGTVSTFVQPLRHEVDLVSLAQSGHDFFGESFKGNTRQTFNFSLPDRAPGQRLWARTRLVGDGLQRYPLRLAANGTMLPGNYTINAQNNSGKLDTHIWGIQGQFDAYFSLPDSVESLAWGVNINSDENMKYVYLDFIDINYTRKLRYAAPQLLFSLSSTAVTLDGADDALHIWDVTDPLDISAVSAEVADGCAGWRQPTASRHDYVAWKEAGALPTPTYVGAVHNQDIHARLVAERPEMVIFTASAWASEAERLANIHRYGPDSLAVSVFTQDLVFNEFASGIPDPSAFRKLLKMAYDLGNEEGGRPLRFALLFGQAIYDNRAITEAIKNSSQEFVPTWQTDNAISDYNSYSSDDFFGILSDNSSPTRSASLQDIAVGRIPCRTLSQAKSSVDKLIKFLETQRPGMWRNTVVALADNADKGAHLSQTEKMIYSMLSTPGGASKVYNKAYLDAYDIINGVCVGARNRLHRQLEEGALLWTYVGHGNINSLTGERVFTSNDIDQLYLRNLPILYAATCDFSKWDNLQPSGAERLFFTSGGGVIASICPTRTAQINYNGILSAEFGRHIFETDETGRTLPLGESLRLTKNAIVNSDNSNRRRYVLMGSPAMRPLSPELTVKLETINGETVGLDKQITLKARQRVTMTGIICDASGKKVDNFSGPLFTSLYDAAESVTTKGLPHDGTEGKVDTFDDRSSLLAQSRDSVRSGEWSITLALPSEIADNFRPAQAAFFASSNNNKLTACGSDTTFYVFGFDDLAEVDTIPPTVDYAYLNHESFTPGALVNEQPMYIASVSDNVGINLSMAGIGHQMTLTIDDKTVLSDVSLYYAPHADGTQGGVITYPLPTLSDGDHKVTLRVWDTSGNVTYHTLNFAVQAGARPDIFDIYTDANPASVEANFYVEHNRPDAIITVTFEVYDLLGRRLWTSTQTDRSDMFMSAPVKWDLRTLSGTRVQRGIYIYRAIVTSQQGEIKSKAKRIAVSGH